MSAPRFSIPLAVGILLFSGAEAHANGFWLPTGSGAFGDLPVRSMMELKYLETVRQRLDFSCGSAAVATLLTHHYDRPTKESEVFLSMWETGDQQKIPKHGFSMLDMKRFLDSVGFSADGFQIPASRIGKVGVAGIVLLEGLHQPHFVVVTGEHNGEILVSDPARGVWSLRVETLEELWNGIFFVVRKKASLARSNFNDFESWKHRRLAPVSAEALGRFAVPDPLSFPLPLEYNFE
ncbi:C39 family peptidase [Myxococcota bacterium]|nr:C39 family peptidase [Myxococcota bacterium]